MSFGFRVWLAAVSILYGQAAWADVKFSQEILATKAGYSEYAEASHDCKRVMLTLQSADRKTAMILNGKTVSTPDMQMLAGLALSPAGTGYAFTARINAKFVAVVNGQQTPPEIIECDTRGNQGFSPDGGRYAFTATPQGGGRVLFCDGKILRQEKAEFQSAQWLADNRLLTQWSAPKGGLMMVDDQALPTDAIGVIGGAGKRLAYLRPVGESTAVVVDGKELMKLTASPYAVRLSFSPDGKKLAVIGAGALWVDGIKSALPPGASLANTQASPTVAWSPDGSGVALQLAATVKGETVYRVWANGKLWKAHFTAPLQSLQAGGKSTMAVCQVDKAWKCYVDDADLKLEAHVDKAWLSPDGLTVAALVWPNPSTSNIVIVRDGKRRTVQFPQTVHSPVAFSPDGKHVAVLRHGGLNVDGVDSPACDSLQIAPVFEVPNKFRMMGFKGLDYVSLVAQYTP